MRLRRTNVQRRRRGSVEKKAPEALNRLLRVGLRSNFRERRLGSASPHTLRIPNAGVGLQKDFGHILDTVITNKRVIFRGQGAESQNFSPSEVQRYPLFLNTSLNNPVFARAESEQLEAESHIYTKIIENNKKKE